MMGIDLTPAYLARLEKLAKKATPGPWEKYGALVGTSVADVIFITTKKRQEDGLFPVTRVDFTEPLSKRKANKFVREQQANAAYIAAVSPDVVLALLGRISFLEKEANWLADRCHEFCDSNNYCYECTMYPGNLAFPHPDCGQKIDVENARWRFEKHVVSDWREAAYKAVEEQCKK